jgi:cell division protein FtsI/penicillin-binding protein 2
MKKYTPLNKAQRAAISNLGAFFDPTPAKRGLLQASQDKDGKPAVTNTSKSAASKHSKTTEGGNMERYRPLNSAQRAAISSLGAFFDPSVKSESVQASQDKDEKPAVTNTRKSAPSRYISVADQLTPEEKAKLKKHEKEIEAGFKHFSAY